MALKIDYPPSLLFTRKSGETYAHIGREVGEHPTYITYDWVRSLSTGKIRRMSEIELKKFKCS